MAGALGGANLSRDLGTWLGRLGLSPEWSQRLGFLLVVAFITYLSLVVGELVPKSLALNNAEGIATRVAKPMGLLSKVTAPVVWLLSVSTNGVLRLLGVKEAAEQPVTEDEINIYIAQGVKAGAFAEEEREIVERVFRAADRRVASLMTPRREIVYLDVEDAWEENAAKIAAAPHSAFPVCEGGLDKVLGIAVLKRLWKPGAPVDLRAAATAGEPMYVLETERALSMLEKFRGAGGRHVALVVDEYGNVVGLLTLYDVLEGIVGEVPTEEEASRPGEDRSAIRRDDGSWLLDGMLPVAEMVHLLGLRAGPEDADEYNTLGGFVMARLGRIPATGERFEWSGVRFEVLDMDGHRVDRVLAAPEGPSPIAGAAD